MLMKEQMARIKVGEMHFIRAATGCRMAEHKENGNNRGLGITHTNTVIPTTERNKIAI
jgi:hypothetical protein